MPPFAESIARRTLNRSALLAAVQSHYAATLQEHGPSARGVDWNSAASQELRFEQLARLFPRQAAFSVIDYGCGYGALLDWLRQQGLQADYVGLDLCPAMIEAARGRRREEEVRFTSDPDLLEPRDFAVASGVFNVKLRTPEEEWREYVCQELDALDRLSRRGFGFNLLTRYADADRMRADLFYADPSQVFDRCMERYSRRVRLLHDYPLYEFTVLVWK